MSIISPLKKIAEVFFVNMVNNNHSETKTKTETPSYLPKLGYGKIFSQKAGNKEYLKYIYPGCGKGEQTKQQQQQRESLCHAAADQRHPDSVLQLELCLRPCRFPSLCGGLGR